MITEQERDYILCECTLESLNEFTTRLEREYSINITKLPSICLTMVRAEDSVESQEFYLGEALTSECEVEISETIGYGLCLGDEPERAYCIAVVDALLKFENESRALINEFLDTRLKEINHREKIDFNQIIATKVDFKLMEQA